MEWPDAVKEYLRVNNKRYADATKEMAAAYKKIGVKHEQVSKPANPQA
jgi:hypothetical protein